MPWCNDLCYAGLGLRRLLAWLYVVWGVAGDCRALGLGGVVRLRISPWLLQPALRAAHLALHMIRKGAVSEPRTKACRGVAVRAAAAAVHSLGSGGGADSVATSPAQVMTCCAAAVAAKLLVFRS